MKPSMSQILIGAAGVLNTDIAPHLQDSPFAVGRLGTIGLILACVAQEAERAAETAVREQDALRALLADAANEPLEDPDLRARARAAGADSSRPSLRLSDLEAKNAELKLLVMAILESVEREEFDWALKMEQRIWRLLKAGADRRALFLPVL